MARRRQGASKPKWAPHEHPVFKELGLNPDHIMDHIKMATDEEVAQGLRWYSDAHLLAHAIGGGDLNKGAGLLAVYSPQTMWPANIHNAIRSAHRGKALGPGEGLMISQPRQEAAQKILDGADHQKVLTTPKVNDFAYLIHHGGDLPGERPRVVIDRHAMAVLAGRRLRSSDFDFGSSLSTRHYYQHPSGLYVASTPHASQYLGHDVAPHQVQAITWLVRKRLNDIEDEGTKELKGRQTVERNEKTKVREFRDQHYPDLSNPHISHQRLAYGETRAPSDVDTLREDSCPVCGETDSFMGDRCQVCGFARPPQMFQDPNLEIARQVDLRKDVADQNGVPERSLDGEQVGDDPAQAGTTGLTGGPLTPDDITEDGMPLATDTDDLADQQVQQIQQGGPLTPEQLGPNGEVVTAPDEEAIESGQGGAAPDVPVDPDAADRRIPQGGDVFQPGPNAPGEPEGPEGPMTPDQRRFMGDDDDEEPSVGGQPVRMMDEGPGTPGDGVADLVCPSCGFQSMAQQPMTRTDDPFSPAGTGEGMLEGDACPRCGKATMLSLTNVM